MMTRRLYLSIILLFFVLLVMFMFITISSDMLTESSVNKQAEVELKVHREDALLENVFDETTGKTENTAVSVDNNPGAAIIVSDPYDSMSSTLAEWCIYNKFRYRIFTGLPEAEVLSGYDTVLFGKLEITAEDTAALKQYADTGIPMIFTCLPAYGTLLKNPELADFFGIDQCLGELYQLDGVKVFGDFFLSRERIYTYDDDYGELDDMAIKIPYYTLRAGYDMYAVAVLENQGGIKNEDLPAILWRTYTGTSSIFVVNSDVFCGERLLGVITAFMSQAYEFYVYPVVNSQNIVILNYPYLSNENLEEITRRYSRSPQALCRDILWPNIVKILRNYGKSYNFFIAPQLDFSDKTGPLENDVVLYRKEIEKLTGVMGLSLGQVSSAALDEILARDNDFLKEVLPAYDFTAIYTGGFRINDLMPYFSAGRDSVLSSVTLALTDFEEGTRLIRFAGDDVLAISMTINGFRHEAIDDIQMIALETALGLCTQQVDMNRVLFPQGDADDWSELSRNWSEDKTYFSDFKAFDYTSVYELESRVRDFLALNFYYQKADDCLEINIDHFNEEAWFVLRVHNETVVSVKNGTAEQFSDTAYLIKATGAAVTVRLQETDYLSPPENDTAS